MANTIKPSASSIQASSSTPSSVVSSKGTTPDSTPKKERQKQDTTKKVVKCAKVLKFNDDSPHISYEQGEVPFTILSVRLGGGGVTPF